MESFDLGWLLGMSKNPVALGLLIFGLVQTVKRQAETRTPPLTWKPWGWRTVAAVIGLVCSFFLHLWTGNAVLGAQGWPGVLVFGLVAAVVAMAGRDGLKTVLGWIGGTAVQTTTQATTQDGAQVQTTTTIAPAQGLPAAPLAPEGGPPPEAFEQAGMRGLLSLPAEPAGEPVTHPAYRRELREGGA